MTDKLRIIHVYPAPCESVYPQYAEKGAKSDVFDLEVMCNTDLEVRYLAGFHKLGDRCTLLYPRRFRLFEKSFTHHFGYEIRRFPATFFDQGRCPLCLGMLRYIWKERPDVVHYHHIYRASYFPLSMLLLITWLCRFLRIPVFGWYHIGTLPSKRGRFPFVRAFYRKIRIYTLRRLSGITSICHNELDRLFDPKSPHYYGVDFSHVPHLHTGNTIDASRFKSCSRVEAISALEISPDKRYVLMVSRLFREKGLHYLIRAVADLRTSFPNIHLMVVGDFLEEAEDYRREVDELVNELEMNEFITFAGRVEHKDGLANYFNAADVFVLPTYMDSFAAVNIEAIGCGIPVVSTDREEIPYYLKPGVGILVRQHDQDALNEAVRHVLDGTFVPNAEEQQLLRKSYDYPGAAKRLRNWYLEQIAKQVK